jgi:asparaginyl-tRNA synthetase
MLIEAEAAHYDLTGIQDVLERLLHKLCADVVVHRRTELDMLEANVEKLANLKLPFERITYTEAIELLRRDFPVSWGEDLKAEHERALGQQIGQPFFVSHYPKAIKFFNMKTDPMRPEIALACDLLVPGVGEIVGSAEREDDYDQLLEKLEDFLQDEKRRQDIYRLGIDPEQLSDQYHWYLELRQVGKVSHAGFGLGFERLIQWVCDFSNIAATTEFPKNRDHLTP